MDNEKIENLLNLSLNSTLNERERSSVLDVGYVQQENSWEVVIKFSGNLDHLRRGRSSSQGLMSGRITRWGMQRCA